MERYKRREGRGTERKGTVGWVERYRGKGERRDVKAVEKIEM